MSCKTYVLYGFNKSNEEEIGFFGKKLDITSNQDEAMRFPTSAKKGQIGFGTPEQWLEFINADDDINHGYKFHLVGLSK